MEEKEMRTASGYDPGLISAKLRRWERYLQMFTLPTWDELPDFELYMDQVIALLDKYLDFLPEEERVGKTVTASAINNYVRLKVMPPPNKKRYSRIHIAYLIMICTLKQTLSIAEVSRVLPLDIPEDQVRVAYDRYVERHRICAIQFIELIREAALPILEGRDPQGENVEQLVSMSAVFSNLSRLLVQKLIHLKFADPEGQAID